MKRPWLVGWLLGFTSVVAVGAVVWAFVLVRQQGNLREENAALLAKLGAGSGSEAEVTSLRAEVQRLRGELQAARTTPVAPVEAVPATNATSDRTPRPPRRSAREEERPETLIAKGLTLAQKEAYAEAESAIARAVVLAPRDPVPLFHLSYLALNDSDWAQALSFLRMAVQLDDSWLSKAPNPVLLFGGREKYIQFLSDLEDFVGRNPADAGAKALLAFHLYIIRTAAHARGMAMEALAIDPEQAEAKALVQQLDKAGE